MPMCIERPGQPASPDQVRFDGQILARNFNGQVLTGRFLGSAGFARSAVPAERYLWWVEST
jgi:hypothetical protein